MLPASLALLLSVSTAFADPQSPDTLILPNGSEISGLPFLHNWTSPEAARSLRWPTCKPSSSAMARPTAITLHETGAPNPDFGDPTGKNRCIHFMVQRDGTILQIAPLDYTWGHAPNAGHAIGIEIANGADGVNFSTSSGTDRLAVKWSGARYVYWMTAPQFDNLYALIDVLTGVDFDGDGTADIPRKVANTSLVDGYVLLSSQGTRVSPAADAFLGSWEGILSHSIYALATEIYVGSETEELKRSWVQSELRNDGGAAALYVYYRFNGYNEYDARCRVQAMARDAMVTDRTPFAAIGIAAADFPLQTWKMFSLNDREEACTGEVAIPIPGTIDLGGE